MKTIIFVFAGRRANLELQLPLIRRILDRNPTVEYHLWNLCRRPADSDFLHTIRGDRITVRDDFYGRRSGMNLVYQHYTDPAYRDAVFVKMDDDIVFLETERFPDFVAAIRPGMVLSAKVINNGACTLTERGLFDQFEALHDPVIGSVSPHHPLLDVHLSFDYADACHAYMFEHWRELLDQPTKLIPTSEWLSINLIGFDWDTNRRIAAKVGQPHRKDVRIAGRPYKRGRRIGDEGTVNTLPRTIFQGFLAAHLTFGPQITVEGEHFRVQGWRRRYRHIGDCYLAERADDGGCDLSGALGRQ